MLSTVYTCIIIHTNNQQALKSGHLSNELGSTVVPLHKSSAQGELT